MVLQAVSYSHHHITQYYLLCQCSIYPIAFTVYILWYLQYIFIRKGTYSPYPKKISPQPFTFRILFLSINRNIRPQGLLGFTQSPSFGQTTTRRLKRKDISGLIKISVRSLRIPFAKVDNQQKNDNICENYKLNCEWINNNRRKT